MSGALSTAKLCMVKHPKNISATTSLFLSFCFPKMSISPINVFPKMSISQVLWDICKWSVKDKEE